MQRKCGQRNLILTPTLPYHMITLYVQYHVFSTCDTFIPEIAA